jgi:serine protease Do
MHSTSPFLRRALFVLGLTAAAGLTLPATSTAQTPERDVRILRGITGGAQLGVSIRDVSDADAKTAKLGAPAGALVQSVQPDSPASKAGLQANDVVISFDGERVRSAAHLARLVDETPAGRTVDAVVQRGGERVTLRVAPEAARGVRALAFDPARARTLANDLVTRIRPQEFAVQRPFVTIAGPARLGVSVQELTGQLGEYFGASSGVLVTSVRDDSPARTAGLRAGDVITRAGSDAVSNAADLRRRLATASGEMTLTIVRDRKEQTITVTIPDSK